MEFAYYDGFLVCKIGSYQVILKWETLISHHTSQGPFFFIY